MSDTCRVSAEELEYDRQQSEEYAPTADQIADFFADYEGNHGE